MRTLAKSNRVRSKRYRSRNSGGSRTRSRSRTRNRNSGGRRTRSRNSGGRRTRSRSRTRSRRRSRSATTRSRKHAPVVFLETLRGGSLMDDLHTGNIARKARGEPEFRVELVKSAASAAAEKEEEEEEEGGEEYRDPEVIIVSAPPVKPRTVGDPEAYVEDDGIARDMFPVPVSDKRWRNGASKRPGASWRSMYASSKKKPPTQHHMTRYPYSTHPQ